MIFELCGLLFIFFVLRKCIKEDTKDLPPGPWALPLFGHLLTLGTKPHFPLMKWKKKYGPILYCKFGSHPTVVLQDAQLVRQAFSMPEFSGRGEVVPVVMGSLKKGIALSETLYNVEQRQFALRGMRDFGIGTKSIEGRIHEGIQSILDKIEAANGRPMTSKGMLSYEIVSILWSFFMTEKVSKEKTEELRDIVEDKIDKMGPTLAQLALFMPWMDRLCRFLTFGTTWITKWKTEGFKDLYRFMGTQIIERSKTRIKDNPRDFADTFLDRVDESTDPLSAFYEKNGVGAYLLGDLFIGGVETTSSTLEWFFYYMAKHPEVQKKFQKEIDMVVGSSRLPSLSDKLKMTYADAITYETLRFGSIFPLGLHHQTLNDVTFHGYRIPKNTMVFANLYAIHHDEEIWGDPQSFRPERWLVGGEEVKNLKGEYFLPFSTGRRACPGEMLARDQLFLYMTSILQRFSLSFPDNRVPLLEECCAITTVPGRFKIIFKPRETNNSR